MTTKRSEERGRITARIPQLVVEELEEAAALAGVTVNQFIVQAATFPVYIFTVNTHQMF